MGACIEDIRNLSLVMELESDRMEDIDEPLSEFVLCALQLMREERQRNDIAQFINGLKKDGVCKEIESIWDKSLDAKEPQKILKNVFSQTSRRNFVQFCVGYLYGKNKECFFEYDNKLSLNFFTLLWKSLLLGEFYGVPDYCQTIQSSNGSESDKNNDGSIVPYNPSVVRNYTIIKKDIQEFCEKIKVEGIKEKKSKPTVITLDVSSAIVQEGQEGTLLFEPLRNLTHKILEMTRLDLYYVSTVENAKQMGILYEKLKTLHEVITYGGSFDGVKIPLNYGSKDKQTTKNIIEALMFKTKGLIKGMLGQEIPNEDKEIAYTYGFLKDIFEGAPVVVYDTDKNNVYWNYLKTGDNKNNSDRDNKDRGDYWTIGEDKFKKKYLKIKQEDETEQEQENLNAYDFRSKEGRRLHFENQELFKKVHEKGALSDKDIADYLNKTKDHSIEQWNPALLIRFVKHIINKNDKQEITIDALESLHGILYRLKEIVFKYQRDDFSAPLYFRPSFEYSFLYKQDNDDKIFFASFLSRPVNIVFLDRFCMKYEHLYQKWMGEKMVVMRNAIINAQKEVGNAKEKVLQTEEKVISVSQEVRDERGRSLQHLGILGAFIAFASSIVGLQKVVNNIWEYVLFASTYVLCIFMFALCIFRISWHGDKAYMDKRETIFKKNYRIFRNKDYAKLIKRIAFSISRYDIGVIVFFILSVVVAYVIFIGRGGEMADNNDVINSASSINVQMIQSSAAEQQDMNESQLQQLTDTLPKTKSDSFVLRLPSSKK